MAIFAFNESLANLHNLYYVYTLQTDTGAVVYVGCGRLKQILTFKDVCGSPDYDPSAAYILTAISSHVRYVDAYNAVCRYILELGKTPLLNFGRALNRERRMVLCEQTGQTFASAAEAAKLLGLPAGNLSRHLAKQSGYKTVRGLTFKYVLR
jgi:hypothetical protein